MKRTGVQTDFNDRRQPSRYADSEHGGTDNTVPWMRTDDVWLWAHAWEEPGCLGSPTTASNYWRFCSRIACHHRIDGYICRREDLPLGRELSFDVVRSVPNSPQHGPTVKSRSLRAPAKLAAIVNNCRRVCQARWSSPLFHAAAAMGGGRLSPPYSLKRASRQSNAARSPFSCLI